MKVVDNVIITNMSRYPITLKLERSAQESERDTKTIVNVLVYEHHRTHEELNDLEYIVLREADTFNLHTVINHKVKDPHNPDNFGFEIR